jgi:tetratricopeptide (TPR) repeat protein
MNKKISMMKSLWVLALVLAAAVSAASQAGTQAPAAQSQPANQSQPAAQPQPANQSQPAANAPGGRPPIQAKTQAEYQAYKDAIANAQHPEAMEKAANDFAAKFPTSDLRVLLYRTAMQSYQSAGDSQKMMDMGLKVLSLDKDDPEALIGVAEIQEERTTPMDLDRDQRMSQAIENAEHALQTIDTDLAVPAGTPADRVDAYKKYLRSTAYAIIGTIQYKREQFADAETNFRKSIEADPANPDAVIVLRLALALDQEKKYPDALEQAKRAVDLTKDDSEVGKAARSERDRLVIETGGNNAPATPAQPSSAPAQPPSAPPPASGVAPSH